MPILHPVFTEWELSHVKETDINWVIEWYWKIWWYVEQVDKTIYDALQRWEDVQKPDARQWEINFTSKK